MTDIVRDAPRRIATITARRHEITPPRITRRLGTDEDVPPLRGACIEARDALPRKGTICDENRRVFLPPGDSPGAEAPVDGPIDPARDDVSKSTGPDPFQRGNPFASPRRASIVLMHRDEARTERPERVARAGQSVPTPTTGPT